MPLQQLVVRPWTAQYPRGNDRTKHNTCNLRWQVGQGAAWWSKKNLSHSGNKSTSDHHIAPGYT